jgi:AAA domain
MAAWWSSELWRWALNDGQGYWHFVFPLRLVAGDGDRRAYGACRLEWDKDKEPWDLDGDDGGGSGDLQRYVRDCWNRREKVPGSSARAKFEGVFDVDDVEAPTPELAKKIAAARAAGVATEAAKAAEADAIAADSDDDGLEIISADEWFEVEGTADERHLVSELLDLGAVSVLYAPSNEGKSFVGAGLGYAVATGAPWGGRETTKGAVVYVAYEGARRFRRRLAALIAHYMPGGPVPLYLVNPPKSSIYSPAWQAAILKTVAKIEKFLAKRSG